MNNNLEKGFSKIACAIICVGLAYLGFEYDSVWCFIGSILAFLAS